MGNLVHLSLGSNLEDKLFNLTSAIEQISLNCGQVIKQSPIYCTPPFGFESDDDFLNICLLLDTYLSPENLLNCLKNIEIDLGRKKKSENGHFVSRLIDIDIILFGDQVITSDALTIPHPEYTQRRFVIKPLEDISPNIIDPKNGKSIKQLNIECADTSPITPYEQ